MVVAQWLLCKCTGHRTEQSVWCQALAEDIVLCSWAGHLSLILGALMGTSKGNAME